MVRGMRIVAGVDVGLSGAVALVTETEVLAVFDMPVHSIAAGKKGKRAELDLAGLRGILSRRIDHVFIERVSAMPKQGVTGMFRFGYCAGAVAGMVAALGLPYTMLIPRTWQRMVGCGAAGDSARQRAVQLYPQVAGELSRKRDAGWADAVLIGYAGLMLRPRREVEAEVAAD
jgi:crossover junction endodeoxyribonuclease RuvC